MTLPNHTLGLLCKNQLSEVDNCYIRLCNENDYQEVLNMQNSIMVDLKNSRNEHLFIPTEDQQIKELLIRKDVLFLGVQTPVGLCAYSYTFFSNDIAFDLSYNFTDEKVATFDSVVVLPDWRGNKLHAYLLSTSIQEAQKRGYTIMAATVAPDNVYSINNFLSDGFEVFKNTEGRLYEGYERYIMYKKI